MHEAGGRVEKHEAMKVGVIVLGNSIGQNFNLLPPLLVTPNR